MRVNVQHIRLTAILVLLITGLASWAGAQIRVDRRPGIVWSAPNGAFSIEVPVNLKSEPTSLDRIELFGGKTSDCVFVVYVYDVPEEKKGLSLAQKSKGLQFVLGGDDDHNFSEIYSKIDGLDAKAIVYAKQSNRGLIIDGGGKIYILGLAATNRKHLNSKVANRFFSSFRIRKH